MPHATEDETMDDAGEAEAISSFIGMQGFGDGEVPDYQIDQRDKAQDAVDYENISDDGDLPDEEEATHPLDGDGDDETSALVQQLAGKLDGLPGQDAAPKLNGNHAQDGSDGPEGELFGESDDVLFGEHSSSPEQQRAQIPNQVGPGQHSGGLVLPGKSGLALPGSMGGAGLQTSRRQSDFDHAVGSPSFQDDGYSPAASLPGDESSDEELDPTVKAQRELFGISKRRVAGEDVQAGTGDFDLDMFYDLFPRYDKNQNPRFLELFPPRAVKYRGKVPFKPPKPVQPTKISLDLLQDQEKSFRSLINVGKQNEEPEKAGLVYAARQSEEDDSDDDMVSSAADDGERIGGVTGTDLSLICDDWDAFDPLDASDLDSSYGTLEGEWKTEEQRRPKKKRRTDVLDMEFALPLRDARLPFEEPEHTTAKIAKRVALDRNDPNLLIDEVAPPPRKKIRLNDTRRDATSTKDLEKRYNISNDEAYDLLKENHQHKVRSTLSNIAIEHSMPASRLQFPFYRVNLEPNAKRSFHRPHLDIRDGRNREFKFQKLKHVKRKQVRNREVRDLFRNAEDLQLGDNSSLLLLEYSEEAPMLLSNFGMGNRLINYYRKRNSDDPDRPKRNLGETQLLLTQDKSPFSSFGHVDQGEVVPTVQNGLFRAPAFEHQAKNTDFLVGLSSTYGSGHRFSIRNIENLYTVGQQLPLSEVPTEHSRKVTDAAKKRLRALSYRIYTKSQDRPGRAKPLNNENIMKHLPGHDMPQTRSKMREFMNYERAPGKDSGGVWVPRGDHVPDADTLRSWIKPEDVCLLESMQVGVQHLTDLGLYSNNKEGDEDKDVDESANIEVKLAPWHATKNFLNACQGKAMLKLHGEGDPTARGEGFSFVKTSMKGGFQALGESAQDKLDAKKRKETGGHSYNVAKQQKAYDESIRRIWDKQKASLETSMEMSDFEDEDEPDAESTDPVGRATTPRSVMGTPSAFGRFDDESASQFSRASADRGDKVMIITRYARNEYGETVPTHEKITNSRVISLYRARAMEKKLHNSSALDMIPTGDRELDEYKKQQIQKELLRIERNRERRLAREKAKGKVPASPSAAASSPAANGDGGDTSAADATPQKNGRGRGKDGTARKCANCGQVGHIKTNRKLCPMLNGTMKPEDATTNSNDNSFGAVPAPLTL